MLQELLLCQNQQEVPHLKLLTLEARALFECAQSTRPQLETASTTHTCDVDLCEVPEHAEMCPIDLQAIHDAPSTGISKNVTHGSPASNELPPFTHNCPRSFV